MEFCQKKTQSLYQRGLDAIERLDPAAAAKLFEKALHIEPTNTVILEILGETYIELDLTEKAFNVDSLKYYCKTL